MACAIYDFVFNENAFSNENDLITLLKGIAKKFVFQLEKGEKTGYLHYQGRLSLIKKCRPGSVLKLFNDGSKPNWIRPTIKTEADKYAKSGDAFYQMKEQTRVKGPFSDKDEVVYIPRQIREVKQLRPFQQSIVENAGNWDTRHINLVYCPEGNKGKSILVGYCRAYKIGRALPPVNDFKDMMRMVCNMPTARMYLIDMPRSLNKDRLYQFYSGGVRLQDLRGSNAIAQLSNIAIALEGNRQAEDPEERNMTVVRVLKNRFSGETGVCGYLKYDSSTGRLSEVDDYDCGETL